MSPLYPPLYETLRTLVHYPYVNFLITSLLLTLYTQNPLVSG